MNLLMIDSELFHDYQYESIIVKKKYQIDVSGEIENVTFLTYTEAVKGSKGAPSDNEKYQLLDYNDKFKYTNYQNSLFELIQIVK